MTTSIEAKDCYYGLPDDSFQAWITQEIAKSAGEALVEQYPRVFAVSPAAIVQWRKRYRGNPALWQRLFSKDRVVKELVEAVPILDAVLRFMDNSSVPHAEHKLTVIDLCCGKGYLSMLLSELLDPQKVAKFILIDKAWPMIGEEQPSAHHINPEHIYGTCPATGKNYQETWPIPLQTSKQDLKRGRVVTNLGEYVFQAAPGPILLLAIHLCGTLSLKSVDLFNQHHGVAFFALKPCCLPGKTFIKQKTVFTIGQHSFNAAEVCSWGRWKNNQWRGPPRHTLTTKFQAWASNLFQGVDVCQVISDNEQAAETTSTSSNGEIPSRSAKTQAEVRVQTDGGYQNSFIFAERCGENGKFKAILETSALATRSD